MFRPKASKKASSSSNSVKDDELPTFLKEDDRTPKMMPLYAFRPSKYAKKAGVKGKLSVCGQLVHDVQPEFYKYLSEYGNDQYKENECVSIGVACWVNRNKRIIHSYITSSAKDV